MLPQGPVLEPLPATLQALLVSSLAALQALLVSSPVAFFLALLCSLVTCFLSFRACTGGPILHHRTPPGILVSSPLLPLHFLPYPFLCPFLIVSFGLAFALLAFVFAFSFLSFTFCLCSFLFFLCPWTFLLLLFLFLLFLFQALLVFLFVHSCRFPG